MPHNEPTLNTSTPCPLPDHAPPTDGLSRLLRQAQTAPTGHWDELRGQSQTNAQAPASAYLSGEWARFFDPLAGQSSAGLNAHAASLARQVRDNGITYNVYADAQQPQRPWALDLLPLMVDPVSWAQIEAGVLQRMQLLEHIMADTYGPQTLLRQGLLPAELVQGHPGYLHAMQGAAPVGDRFLSLAAFDLARGPDGCWWLLSQRTQAPSGLGYLLENRQLLAREFPDAFEAMPVQHLAATYRALVEGIQARSPAGRNAHIALLTPGPYNETYFEHAYLARHLGLTLVQGSDLTVRQDHLFLKTLQGLQPVHGLLKRVDDAWLDPLELRPESTLGVPGLLQAVRAGNVLVANTPGSGFLESNALLGFMPALARSVLNEALQLPAIPSWWCGEQAALQDVLPRMGDCVIKPTYPPHSGRSSFEPVLGRDLSQRERDEWAGRILRDGAAHTLQAYLPLSHTPTWDSATSSLTSRPVILRVFAVADARGAWRVLPGGLARLGTREGIASMQRGGSSADVWVANTATAAAQADALDAPIDTTNATATDARSDTPAPADPQPRQRVVTSRAAENLFWLGRYTERAENTLRLASLSLQVLNGENAQNAPLLAWLGTLARRHGLIAAGVPTTVAARRVLERSLVAGLWDSDTPSLGHNLQAIRSAASAVRERLSPEHWQLIEHTQAQFLAAAPRADADAPTTGQATRQATVQAQRALAQTSQLLAAQTGAQTDRMTRDDGWRLLSVGRHIERLDFLSQALANALDCGTLHSQAGFDAVLALFDSTISFHAQYQQSRTLPALLDLLVVDPDNPRALRWVAQTLRARLARMGHLAGGATEALSHQVPALWSLNLGDLCTGAGHSPTPALADWLAQGHSAALSLSDSLSALFFTHSREAEHTIGI